MLQNGVSAVLAVVLEGFRHCAAELGHVLATAIRVLVSHYIILIVNVPVIKQG